MRLSRYVTTTVLQCGHQGQGRLGTLVEVGAGRAESVGAATGLLIQKLRLGVVVAEEPTEGQAQWLDPRPVAGQRERSGARVRQCRGFDRLLVEARAGLPWPPSTDRCGRQVAVVC